MAGFKFTVTAAVELADKKDVASAEERAAAAFDKLVEFAEGLEGVTMMRATEPEFTSAIRKPKAK